jgi:hypothetical protein
MSSYSKQLSAVSDRIAKSAKIFRDRFVTPDIQQKYDLELPAYEGVDQVVEVDRNGEKL